MSHFLVQVPVGSMLALCLLFCEQLTVTESPRNEEGAGAQRPTLQSGKT